MKSIISGSICLFVLLTSFGVNAAGYKCIVIDGKQVSEDGKLISLDDFFSPTIGKEFVVDRETGKIISKTFGNSHADNIEVLDQGSSENSFKSIAHYGPNRTISYLVINQFHEQKAKSFTYWHTFGAIYSGTCEQI